MVESGRISSRPGYGRDLAIWAAIIVFSVVITGQVIMGLTPVQVATLAAGGLALLVFGRRPEIALTAMLVIIASIVFEDTLPLLPIPGGSFHVTDVLLLFSVALIPFKRLTDPRFRLRTTPGDLPLLLFLAATLISAGNALFVQRLDFNLVMRLLRSLMYFSVYFVITNFIRERKQIRFLAGAMFGVAVLVSSAMVLQAVVGESVRLLPGRVEAAETFGETLEATRILPPGDILVFVMFITAMTVFSLNPRPRSALSGFSLPFILGAGVVLTYNRNYWGSIVISLLILAALVSKTGKRRIAAWTLIAAVVVAFIPLLAGAGGRLGAYYDSVLQRFSSLLTPTETYGSRSLEWRKMEIDFALRSVARNPVLGIGLGQDYRPRIDWMDFYRQGRIKSHMSYIHNGYLYILVDMGLVGLVPFLWLLLRFLIRGFTSWKAGKDLRWVQGLVLGFTLGGLAIMLSSIVSPRFLEWPGILVLTMLMGLTESAIRLETTPVPAPLEGTRT